MFSSFYKGSPDRSVMNHTILFLLHGAAVRRFHQIPLLHPNTDGQHQWGVAQLAFLIAEEPTLNLIMAALSHDMAEQSVGDVPAPTKRTLGLTTQLQVLEDAVLERNGYLFRLTPEEERILKLADCLEGMLTCVYERGLGNRFVEVPFRRFASYVSGSLEPMPSEAEALRIFEAISDLWDETTSAKGDTANGSH